MNRVPYTNGVKAAVIFLQLLMSVTMIVSLILIRILFRDNIVSFEDTNSQSYEETQYFTEQFKSATKELLQYAEYKDFFETDGVFDSSREIGIYRYSTRSHQQIGIGDKTQTNDEKWKSKLNFSYTVENLDEWSKTGVTEADVSYTMKLIWKPDGYYQSGCLIADGKKTEIAEGKVELVSDLCAQLQDKVLEGLDALDDTKKAETYLDMDITTALDWLQESSLVSNSSGKLLEETYSMCSGDTLLKLVESGEISLTRAMKVGEDLENILKQFDADIKQYKRYLNTYSQEKSNFKYYIYDSICGNVYTNMEDVTQTQLVNIGKQNGAYLYWNSDSAIYDTNVQNIDSFFYDTTDEMNAIGSQAVALFSVDTNYTNEDSFVEMKDNYGKLHPWLNKSIVLTVSGFVIWIVCILFLTAAAGRREEDESSETVHSCWFDRIPTEVLMMAFIIFMLTMIVMYVRLCTGENWNIPGIFIMAGTLSSISYVGFITCYLSIVRRIKCRTIWSGSILYLFIKGASVLMDTRKISTRMVIIYLGHSALLLALVALFFYRRNPFWLALLLLFMTGEGIYCIKEVLQKRQIIEGIDKITRGDLEYKIDTADFFEMNRKMAEGINSIGEGLGNAVDESMKNERMKADLITNVSHDIKTPLTSIINYVNLIKLEHVQNEKINMYADILDEKSQRLKQLTEDLVEASKISSGNITLQMQRLNFVELVYQTAGEFNEKFEAKDLTAVTKLPKEPVIVMADGRRIWRVIENLYNNVAKYALEHTRVYVELEEKDGQAHFSIRNISKQQIGVDTESLTGRFIRGDESRTTEGSGLGLSIAKNLTVLMGGRFEIQVDGDLFRAEIIFPIAS